MLTLKDFMEICNYRITEGSDYQWECYGYNAYSLDSWNGDHNGHSLCVTFDTKTQEVYEVQAFDYTRKRAYRMINPNYAPKHMLEVTTRGIDDYAWEEEDGTPVKFVDLEVDEDFIEKAAAIVAGEDYDTGVMVPLNLEKEQVYEMMLMAHERNITLNQLVEDILRQEIERLQNA